MESLWNQQPRGQKHRSEEENDDCPAQRLRAKFTRLAVRVKLLIGEPETYEEATNDPMYSSKWKNVIHNKLIALVSFRRLTPEGS